MAAMNTKNTKQGNAVSAFSAFLGGYPANGQLKFSILNFQFLFPMLTASQLDAQTQTSHESKA
jgi:hypothetical protein